MAGKWTEIINLRFKGMRFDDAALDASALSEILAMQDLLAEAARILWRVAHPERERLPKGYGSGTRIVLRRIEMGSTVAPLEVEQADGTGQQQEWLDEIEDLKLAASTATAAYEAAVNNSPLPESFPKQLVPVIAKFGERMGADDVVELKVEGRPPVAYTKVARERLLTVQEGMHTGTVELSGRVLAADVRRGVFQLWPDERRSVPIPFGPEHETKVLDALRDHESVLLLVRGMAETSAGGQISKFISVEYIGATSEDRFDANAPSIEDQIAAIFGDVTDEEWEKLPKDGASNLDHYLYGAPKRRA